MADARLTVGDLFVVSLCYIYVYIYIHIYIYRFVMAVGDHL